ncbi:MAG: CBS domain-containing protein [Clostridia bacterium]
MAQAKDIMNRQVISISPKAKIEEAIKVLAINKTSGLPVVDADNKIVGIITERNILEYCEELQVIPFSGTSNWVSPYKDVRETTSFKKGIKLLACTKVENVMSRKVIQAEENASWQEIISLINRPSIDRISIVNTAGVLQGIITRNDLLQYLATGADVELAEAEYLNDNY